MLGSSDRSINSGMEKIQTTIAKIERKGKESASLNPVAISAAQYSGNLQDFCLYLSDCII